MCRGMRMTPTDADRICPRLMLGHASVSVSMRAGLCESYLSASSVYCSAIITFLRRMRLVIMDSNCFSPKIVIYTYIYTSRPGLVVLDYLFFVPVQGIRLLSIIKLCLFLRKI